MRVRTIGTASFWDVTKIIQFIHKVLKSILHNQAHLGYKKAFNNPETVPVVLFSVSST